MNIVAPGKSNQPIRFVYSVTNQLKFTVYVKFKLKTRVRIHQCYSPIISLEVMVRFRSRDRTQFSDRIVVPG